MIPLLHIRNSDIYGSPERLIIGQMRHLRDFESYCATFVAPDSSTPFLDALKQNEMNGIPIHATSQLDRGIITRLRDIIDTRKIQLIVSHDYKANFYAYLANRNRKLPHIGYYHGRTDENLKVKLYNYVDIKILSRVRTVITVSRATASYLRDRGVPEQKITVVYNALDIDTSLTVTQKPPGSPVVVGVIGRLSHEKGVHVFLDALAVIKEKIPPVAVRIYGDGPDRGKLEAQSAKLGLESLVTFMGFETDPEKLYGDLDLMVIPSLSEGHPLIILEAWKKAIGIVATRAGGIPEIIDDNQTGLLTEIKNPKALGERLLDALRDMSAVKQYGRNGLEKLKKNYTYAIQADKLGELYRKAITG